MRWRAATKPRTYSSCSVVACDEAALRKVVGVGVGVVHDVEMASELAVMKFSRSGVVRARPPNGEAIGAAVAVVAVDDCGAETGKGSLRFSRVVVPTHAFVAESYMLSDDSIICVRGIDDLTAAREGAD